MITEDYVSFETAKLLKEKGFPQTTFSCHYIINGNSHYKKFENRCGFGDYDIIAPTLAMAMKWLREMYGLFIRITEDMTGNVFEWSVYQKNYGCKVSTYVEDSYEKACETAIKCCLENLI